MATYLHQEFERLIETTPELTKRRAFGPKGWHMRDKDYKSKATGKVPDALFREFESHDITPASISRMHLVWAGTGKGNARYETHVDYSFGDAVRFKVEGPNRIVVDGINQAFERIAKCMEAGVPFKASAEIASKENWLVKTWREHTAALVIGLVVTVAGAGIGAFLGFN
jgi:hypothetical protein